MYSTADNPRSVLRGLLAKHPALERSGSIHAERLPSGKHRLIARYREGDGSRGARQRSVTIHGAHPEDLPVLRRELVALQGGRRPDRAADEDARRVCAAVRRLAPALRPRDRRALLELFHATGGDFRQLLVVALNLPAWLAMREQRRRGGRPRKNAPPAAWSPAETVAGLLSWEHAPGSS
ncbi:MAG: hypothetical protein JXO22_02590 [Phycisphaerae bacterium]|nr:hypothetical protein [Phycisphaerae bacterium]